MTTDHPAWGMMAAIVEQEMLHDRQQAHRLIRCTAVWGSIQCNGLIDHMGRHYGKGRSRVGWDEAVTSHHVQADT